MHGTTTSSLRNLKAKSLHPRRQITATDTPNMRILGFPMQFRRYYMFDNLNGHQSQNYAIDDWRNGARFTCGRGYSPTAQKSLVHVL